ncbi:MAG TPA: DUF4190 domain-containing protein [Ktedonobacterales bacterium]|nr:DUF4190 domain-containing protein [Ktedonobacterales bacterium]
MSSNPYDPYSSYDPYRKPTENYQQSGPGSYNSYQQQDTYQQQYNPAPDPYASSYSQPPIYAQPVIQPVVQPVIIAARQTNGKAIAAMVLGLCIFIAGFLTGIPAIILGHMALGEINRSGGMQDGRGMAITGLVLGYLSAAGLVCLCLYFVLIAASSGGGAG